MKLKLRPTYGESRFKKIMKEAFTPVNSIITAINIFLFLSLMIFWFWFIGSNQLYIVLENKIAELVNITDNDPVLNVAINQYIEKKRNDTQYIEETRKKIIERNNENIDSFYSLFLPPLIILLLVIIWLAFKIHTSHHKWTRIESILVMLMFSAFFTEVVFFFVVVQDFQYIANSEVLLKLFEHKPQTTIQK